MACATKATGSNVPDCVEEVGSKDEAALWAIPRLARDKALTLAHARQAYLGEVTDNWHGGRDAARRLADQLALNVTEAMTA